MFLTSMLLFTVVVGLMVISPGPNGLLIIKNVPSFGRTSGFFNVAGIVSAFYVHGSLTVFGLSLLILQTPILFLWIKLGGGIYLIYLGLKSLIKLFKAPSVDTSVDAQLPQKLGNTTGFQKLIWYSEGLVTNLLNPKVSLFYIAAFPQFISIEAPSLSGAYLLITIHATIALAWFSFLTIAVERSLARFKQSQRFLKIMNGLSGSLLMGIGINIVALR